MTSILNAKTNPAAAGGSVASPKAPSPAVAKEAAKARTRRPMSAPVRRLETTAIEGYHSHWFRESNIGRAQDAGYEFVLVGEVAVNHRNVALSTELGSTSDLSNRQTIQYGGDTLYLMKLKEELYREDMAAIAERNVEIWSQIFRGEQIVGAAQGTPGDTAHRYVKEANASGSDLQRAQRAKTPLFARKFKA